MRYIHDTLLADEKIIYTTRPHWIIFSTAVASFIIAIAFLWFGPAVGLSLRIFNLTLYQLCALLAAIVGVITLISAFITFNTSEYGVTDKRILMKTGWIRRNALEIFLDKIEAVRVAQTIPGRVLDYGVITIIGTGGTEDSFLSVPDPLGFRRKVQQEIDREEHKK